MNCFRTLEDLVFGYQHPHKGLVSPLLYGVPRDTDIGDESSGAPSIGRHNPLQLFDTRTHTFIHTIFNILYISKQHLKKPPSPHPQDGCLQCLLLFDFMCHVYTDDEKSPPAPSSGNTASVPAAPAKPPAHTLFLDGFQELNTCR